MDRENQLFEWCMMGFVMLVMAFIFSGCTPTKESIIRREATWRNQFCSDWKASVYIKNQCREHVKQYCISSGLEAECNYE